MYAPHNLTDFDSQFALLPYLIRSKKTLVHIKQLPMKRTRNLLMTTAIRFTVARSVGNSVNDSISAWNMTAAVMKWRINAQSARRF